MAPIFHKHPRLSGRDYTKGTYFVTFSAEHRGEVSGRIVGTGADARMKLNETGRTALSCWNAIPDHYSHARVAEVQLMPDHLHAILVLDV